MENVSVLEKAASIAKENLTKIQAPSVEKAKAEASVAAADKAKAEQAKKDEGIKLAAEQEAKTKEDERILTVEDKELSEPELLRKAELKETKRKEDESPDGKIKRIQEASQKRIDEIKSEMLAKENQTALKMAALEAKLSELEKPKQEEDAAVKSKREESERIAKYVEEDKSKPKEERREMSEDDLSEWYLEDPIKATRWIRRNELFRDEERKKVLEANKPNSDTARKLAEDFISKQNESKAKLLARFPGIAPTKERLAELQTKHGKNVDAINADLDAENAEFKLCRTIVAENPKKYIESTDGPELVMAEMEKRLKNTDSKNKSGKIELTQEELDAKIQAEIDRRKLVDGEGITSSTGGKKVETSQKQKSELRQKQELIAKKAGISIEALDKSIARRGTIPGASSGGEED